MLTQCEHFNIGTLIQFMDSLVHFCCLTPVKRNDCNFICGYIKSDPLESISDAILSGAKEVPDNIESLKHAICQSELFISCGLANSSSVCMHRYII